ncbi:NTE family protein [Comamonas sp. BIGb0124]|jgi:NTE family protein|uniref:patatin-like phospholipase family protein n=1 Tax=Comamonas sp. BIGb0124 TaxID=2485130 RepID=UPI000F48F20A|nr:patatin-like phospholipase family protein [Comamonas sp. BIGb0124]ROR26230.1 NTE family protein [Comamonas sp. BIGb0124]
MAEGPVAEAAARTPCALVLMGGGARTAYQAGVLHEVARLLRHRDPLRAAHLARNAPLERPPASPFPFGILLGTSAGAINAAFLASRAHQGSQALVQLARFWRHVHSEQVYSLRTSPWVRWSRIATAYSLVTEARRQGSFLDSAPLAGTLTRLIDFERIGANLDSGRLQALGVTASSYATGEHWTFFQQAAHTVPQGEIAPASWWRSGRRIVQQRLTAQHLLASSALPFLMPAVALSPPAQDEVSPATYFGDGSMRQIAPLSAALYQGAGRILVIGVGQPQRPQRAAAATRTGPPSLGAVAGHAMGSVFHDALQADVEQAQRINRALARLPQAQREQWPYRPVQIVLMQPSQSLDALAERHVHALPAATRHTLQGLGAFHGSGAALASYMLFEPAFVKALMALGADDARARQDELLALLSPA